MERELPQAGAPLFDEILLGETRALWPERWQRVFGQLEALGTAVRTVEPALAPSEADTDLGHVQRALAGAAPSRKRPFQGDGTIVLLRAETSLELADALSALLRASSEPSAVVVRSGEAAVLDSALSTQGLSVLGVNSQSVWRPILQVLPLAVELAFEPRDPYRVLELLTLPVGPFQGRVGRDLASALSEAPGIGGRPWQAAKTAIATWTSEDATKSALANGQSEAEAARAGKDAVSERLAEIAEWFESPGLPATGAPTASLAAVAERVLRWIGRRLGGAHAKVKREPADPQAVALLATAQAAQAQASAFLESLRHEPRPELDRVGARILAEQAARAHALSLTREEVGSTPRRASVAVVIWWSGGTPSRARSGDPRRASGGAASWTRFAPRAFVSATRPSDSRPRPRAGAAWCSPRASASSSASRAGPQATRAIPTRSGTRSAPGSGRATSMSVGSWSRRGRSSPASVSPSVAGPCPPSQTPARLRFRPRCPCGPCRRGRSARRPTTARAASRRWSGVRSGGCSRTGRACANEASRRCRAARFSSARWRTASSRSSTARACCRRAMSAPSRRPSRSSSAKRRPSFFGRGSRSRWSSCAPRSSPRPLGSLTRSWPRSSPWSPSRSLWWLPGAEERCRAGSILLLRSESGRDVVLDLKWGYRGYSDKLRDGKALQLAVYAAARKLATGAPELPAAGYFSLSRAEVIATDPKTFPTARAMTAPPLSETWAKLEATAGAVEKALSKGRIAVTGVERSLPLADALDLPPAEHPKYLAIAGGDVCEYCAYGAICGRSWETLA